jgi:betaine-aldehyde dehydrogenase
MNQEAKVVPDHLSLYYGGKWRDSIGGDTFETINPATGMFLARVANASREDVERAVAAAVEGFNIWRDVPPLERARIMREGAAIFRKHAREIALMDSTDGGNPISEMQSDAMFAATRWEFFAGLVTEMKGSSIPMGPSSVNFSVREPRGVVLRIAPFNHPFVFTAGHVAAALAAGNSTIVKPPEQVPLSTLYAAELLDGLLPPGVFNVVPGLREVGAALASHKDIAMVSLTGSVATGTAVAVEAARGLKPVLLELGGKNAMIAYDDMDPDVVANALVTGMNFTWCGQSCGSMTRGFVHRSIYDAVAARVPHHAARFVPGIPSDPGTTMGSIISKDQYDRVLRYIQSGKDEGARLLCGGSPPTDPKLANGFFIPPTVFADVTPDMTIAREEIFGPVTTLIAWDDEAKLIKDVNAVDYGLTCSIWTHNLERAHRTAQRVQAGYVWINEVGRHFLGAPFGGYKLSGNGREECLEELIAYTQEKHIHVNLAHG